MGADCLVLPYAMSVGPTVSVVRCSRDHMRRCNVIRVTTLYHNRARLQAAH